MKFHVLSINSTVQIKSVIDHKHNLAGDKEKEKKE